MATTVAQVLTQAMSIANSASAESTQYSQAAATAAQSSSIIAASVKIPTVSAYNASRFDSTFEPQVDIPKHLDKTVIAVEFDRIYQLLLAMEEAKLGGFISQYFPIANDGYAQATAWLINTITNGGTGIPAAVEAQIWQRDRDRVASEERRATADVSAEFAALGQPYAPGELRARIQEIHLNSLANNAESSRNTAVKQIEIEIENIRFAVKEALDLRFKAMDAATKYVTALMIGPEIASKYAFQIFDMQSNLINAAANFYHARISRDDVAIRAAGIQSDLETKWTGLIVDNYRAQTEAQVKAAVGAAEAAATKAAAALSTINTIGTTIESA
jgi:hypothetical protein